MEKYIQHLSEAIQNIKPERLIDYINGYIRVCGSFTDKPASYFDNKKSVEIYRAGIQKEASDLLSKIIESRYLILDFRLNGQYNVTDITRKYFSQVKRHQIYMLCHIEDEVKIIEDITEKFVKLQNVIQSHYGILQKAAYLTDTLGQRITRRPTSLLQLKGKHEGISELNQTFRKINEYEDTFGIDKESDNDPKNLVGLYELLSADTFQDIRNRKDRIAAGSKELKNGAMLFIKLATNGYSRWIKRNLDNLIRRHDCHTTEFLNIVYKCRRQFGTEIRK